jgi:hypothetical protein
MNAQIFKTARIALPVFLALFAIPAFAEDVTYSTTGGFSASGGASSATFGGGSNTLTLAFAGQSTATLDASPSTNGSAGFIEASVTGTGNTASGTFTLTIDQTAPSVGTGGLSGNLSGTITSNSSGGLLDFTSTSLTLGNIVYTLQQPPGGYELVSPATLMGETSIQFNITATALPEPTFYGLTGMGFAGLLAMAFHRKKQTATA